MHSHRLSDTNGSIYMSASLIGDLRTMRLAEPLIVGAELGLAPVMARLRRAAKSDVNVLVRGETGTGKELVALALHWSSRRRDGPFVVANCAAIPTELMESELFGHVRGSYTGAVSDHSGFFEAAADGTLLLDEIGDLHINLQAKILRVVEDGSFHRVGSAQPVRNRARLIAATNQPLELLMQHGRFRDDLFFRLDVLTIDIPPLRERRQDVPDLVRHFLVRAQERLALPIPALSPDAMSMLMDYGWPGNVRELRNVVERLMLNSTQVIQRVHVEHLLTSRTTGVPANAVRPLALVERDAIVHALRHFDGNRTRAAEALGIGRRTLQYKIREYGLDGQQNEGTA